MILKMRCELPIKTVSEANSREHWAKRQKRHHAQQFSVRAAFLTNIDEINFPCLVKLSRISPRMLDSHDNLPASLKWIADEIAYQLVFNAEMQRECKNIKKGQCDNDVRIKWEYNQEKGKPQRIRIEIYEL